MKNISIRSCNLCGEKMTGGIPGFIAHGEERHPNHFLNGVLNGHNIEFAEKTYWCPLDNRWYSSLRWLTRTTKKFGFTNERYYLEYGERYMPEIWARNTSDPVLGDARNHNKCLQCDGATNFHATKWEYSAFCGFSCSTKWYADNTDRPQRAMETLKERQKLDPTLQLSPTQLDYWVVKHGMTIEEGKEKVRERQRTNSLERFIERAGGDEIEGKQKWAERQEKWLNSLEARGWFGNHSEVSKRLFATLQESIGKDLLFGEKEISARAGHRVFKLDCVLPGTKKVIEFFGDYWHANPAKYQSDDVVRRLDAGGFVTASEIWARDVDRLETLERHGYDVLLVWENDYVKDTEKTVEGCLSFLNN